MPLVYQNGTAHAHPAVNFGYGTAMDSYYDSHHLSSDPNQHYGGQTFWSYLSSYEDLNTGTGETISYGTATNNTHGTPYITDGNGTILDDRLDPLYCFNQANNSDPSKRCSGVYDFPNDKAWSRQVVTQVQQRGKDTSDPAIGLATTSYQYQMAITGPGVPAQDADCVGDTWIPGNDGDWQDYYHSEFRGFNVVYSTSPAGNLSATHFYSTEGWSTPPTDGLNYNSGAAYEQDAYWGNAPDPASLITQRQETYPGTATSPIVGCRSGTSSTYPACLSAQLVSKTVSYEAGGISSSAPWVQTSTNYDDISPTQNFLSTSTVYHNTLSAVTSSSNAPTLTTRWSYQPTNGNGTGNYSGIFFYHVNLVGHSEVDGALNHVWQCQDLIYDEGRPAGVPTPAAGWATTATAHGKCTQQSSTALTSDVGYDQQGNAVVTVDPVGTATSSLYSTHGCTPATAPSFLTPAWTAGRYTTCTTYESAGAQPTDMSNVLGQHTHTVYDATQGSLPISSTDANGQSTTLSYRYDGSGNGTVKSEPARGNGQLHQSGEHLLLLHEQ